MMIGKPDFVQVHALVVAPWGNANRDELGQPKSVSFCGVQRGRWSSQSQKAALRDSPHMGDMGLGIRSRNMAIGTFEAMIAAGLPERGAMAVTEIVRTGLGSGGKLRDIGKVLGELVSALKTHDKSAWAERLSALVPGLPITPAKSTRKPKEATDEIEGSQDEVETVQKQAGMDKILSALTSKVAGDDKGWNGKTGIWPLEWNVPVRFVERLAGDDDDFRYSLMTVFRADQPLLHSRLELAWKDELEAAVVHAWKDHGHEGVRLVLEGYAPKGVVLSPMGQEAIDLDIALFGRMAASSPEGTVQAALAMAHSMTVGEMIVEADFFTAGEERPRRPDDAVSHLGYSFWTSGIHYKYAVVDMRLLASNLQSGGRTVEEARVLAEKGVSAVLSGMATVLPRGRRTNSAMFSPACYILAERGGGAPVNLAMAFSRPVPQDSPDMVAEAISRLRTFRKSMGTAYGMGDAVEMCAYPISGDTDGIRQVPNLSDVVRAVLR